MDLVKCKRSSSSLVDADWTNLPKDVLGEILIKLIYVADYIRFGAVCKSWLSVAADQKHHRIVNSIQQPPLLLLTDSSNCKLYSVSEGKVYSFGFQFPSNRRFLGSSCGWLAFEEDDYDNLAFVLVNPFTGSRITNLPGIELGLFSNEVFRKVILSHDPSSVCNGGDFVVAAIIATSFYVFVAFIRPYQQKFWTFADCRGADDNNRDFVDDIIFYKGMLYAVKKSHQLIAIDYKCNVGHDDEDEYASCINIVPSIRGSQWGLRPRMSQSHLVEASNGDLLLVDHKDNDNAHLEFQVYKLMNETNPPSWVEIHKLDCGDAIFLGNNNRSLCTSMSCFLNCSHNSIYLARGDWHQIGVFHLDGRMMTKLQGLECLGRCAAPIAWIRPVLK